MTPRILVVSHVLPFPAHSGQRQRVMLTLRALRARFEVTFLTCVPEGVAGAATRLAEFCDKSIVLSAPPRGPMSRCASMARATAYSLRTGGRRSNYHIGREYFPPRRLEAIRDIDSFDCVLFEYWHAHEAAASLRARGVFTVLDMHNVLWRARAQRAADLPYLPVSVRSTMVSRYRRVEESAWNSFDALIAISKGECEYTRSRVPADRDVLLAPMGVDLTEWPYSWSPARPARIAYYGGLGSRHNQRSAIQCAREIMPAVWNKFPRAELWIVGSNPPPAIRALAGDRVRVTGFVQDVASVLREMTAVVCPWQGTYGFRSRIIEAMSVGVPVIASRDAVFGMDLAPERGLLLAESSREFGAHIHRLLRDPETASAHSRAAREQVEAQYGFRSTYGRLADTLAERAAVAAGRS